MRRGIRNSGGVWCDWVLKAHAGPPNHDHVFFFFSFFQDESRKEQEAFLGRRV
jgi:hypothetical protein